MADWKKLAEHVVARRVELGYRTTRQLAQAVGITEKTIGRLELGHSVRSGTLAAVERALGWLPGSTNAILEGGEPQVASAPTAATRQRIIRASADELVDMRAAYEEVMGAEAADEWLRKALRLREASRRETEPESDRDAS